MTSVAAEFRAGIREGSITGWRSGAGPPVLIVHGGPGLSDYTAPLAAELEDAFGVIRYQQRGLAPSTTSGPFGISQHAADAIAILDAAGADRAWVIGHSWGGHLAMHLAVRYPGRVLGLVIADPLGAIPWPGYFSSPRAAPPMPPLSLSAECYAGTFASIQAYFGQHTLERSLPSLTMPAVFVLGAASPIPVRHGIASAGLIPGAQCQIEENCGHFPWLERPGSVRKALDRICG